MARRKTLMVAGALALAWCAESRAITDEEVFRTFRFNFVNPGGRAVAMGGAFVGIADDATAAAANPAGLTNLLSPELFSELRLDDTDATHLTARVADPRGGSGTVLTESTGVPVNVLHPSFISYVKPFKHWVIGVSRQELLHVDSEAVNLFTDKPKFPTTEIVKAEGRLHALIEDYNLSAGFRAGEKFAAGATVSWARMNLRGRTDNLFNFGSGLQNDYSTAVDDSDEDVTANVGVLIKPIEMFRIGLVWRQGARFEFREDILDTHRTGAYPSAGVLADYLGNQNVAFDPTKPPFFLADATFDDPMSFKTNFDVPDQYGIGFGIQPTQAITIAVDVSQVEYSDLNRGFVGNVNALTFPGDPLDCDFSSPNPDGTFPCEYRTPRATYELDDATIVHLGFEYLWQIKEKTPFAVRVGAYNDPNVRLEGDFPAGGVFIADNATFPRGEEVKHYTLGFGFVLQGKFQADFAADLSKIEKTYVASIIYHF